MCSIPDPTCPFCTTEPEEIVDSDGSWIARFDTCPVTPGHLLIIPRWHCTSFNSLSVQEKANLLPFIERCCSLLDVRFHPDGFNIGMNTGTAAGQAVAHLHIHIIPHYVGDQVNPPPGVRAVLSERNRYIPVSRLEKITGFDNPVCIPSSFADLFLNYDQCDPCLIKSGNGGILADENNYALAVFQKEKERWRILPLVFCGIGGRDITTLSTPSQRIIPCNRNEWIAAIREYYCFQLVSRTPPIKEMDQSGRPEALHELIREVWGTTGREVCLDCCCGSGIGSQVIRECGMIPVSYDNMPGQISLGFSRGRLRPEETLCIDATIASRYIDPAGKGIGLMLGDISPTNAGIWERIVDELLILSKETLISVVSEAEALRVKRWCEDRRCSVEIAENPRHRIFDRWVIMARKR
jgi:diadenosine tetraphosphate (Ap4A) HIT family hydrolase